MKLIGFSIVGAPIIVECDDRNAVARAKRAYGKAGIVLRSYDRYARKEAKRLFEVNK